MLTGCGFIDIHCHYLCIFSHVFKIGIWRGTELLCLAVLWLLIFPFILLTHNDLYLSGPPASSCTHSSNQNAESEDKNIE